MKRHVLLFWIGPSLYAISTANVREIVPMATLTPAPGQPPLLRGFLNVRGAALPVIRLRYLFGNEDREPQRYTPLILIDVEDQAFGLELDSLQDVLEVDEASLQGLAADRSANDCARGMFQWEGRDVILLSCELLLLAQERAFVSMLQAAVQQRLSELGPAR